MTAHELANKPLEGPDTELMVLDGFNGGGFQREVNLGPTSRTITEEDAEGGVVIVRGL
jgi:hypothetical protein